MSRLQRLSQLQSKEESVKGPEINHNSFHYINPTTYIRRGGGGQIHLRTHAEVQIHETFFPPAPAE